MTCGDPDTMTDCSYEEHIPEVPDVCAGTPRYWEDEFFTYSETCSQASECSIVGEAETSSSALKIAALPDAGKGGGLLTKIADCYSSKRKGLAALLLCWGGLSGGIAGPPKAGAPPPPNPPNITKVEEAKRKLKALLQKGKAPKGQNGADGGPTTMPTMPGPGKR